MTPYRRHAVNGTNPYICSKRIVYILLSQFHPNSSPPSIRICCQHLRMNDNSVWILVALSKPFSAALCTHVYSHTLTLLHLFFFCISSHTPPLSLSPPFSCHDCSRNRSIGPASLAPPRDGDGCEAKTSKDSDEIYGVRAGSRSGSSEVSAAQVLITCVLYYTTSFVAYLLISHA